MSRNIVHFFCLLASLITSFHSAHAVIWDSGVDLNDQALFVAKPSGFELYGGREESVSKKRYYVIDKGDKQKVHVDAKQTGGEVVNELDNLGISVVEFDNTTDAMEFANLGHSMTVDEARYPMRISGPKHGILKEMVDLNEEAPQILQGSKEIVP